MDDWSGWFTSCFDQPNSDDKAISNGAVILELTSMDRHLRNSKRKTQASATI